MTGIPLTPDEEMDALAAEYVLGVQDLAERMATERRLRTDRALALRVAWWETRLAGLNDGFPEQPAPMHLLPRIEARLFADQPPDRARRGWRIWLGGAVAAVAVGLAVLVLLPDTPAPAVVAELGSQAAGLAYEARHDGRNLLVTRIAGSRPEDGQDHELWIIAPGAAPVSLGVLGDAPLQVAYPPPPAGWVLAVSVEPMGGSPTGAPTGPVILTAEIGA